MKDIGNIIRESIVEHNMTQKEVADIIHISPQTLNSYIHNRRLPNLECFFDLVDLLELNEHFFTAFSYSKSMMDQYLEKTVPTLTFEQKRILFFITRYMDQLNQDKSSSFKK